MFINDCYERKIFDAKTFHQGSEPDDDEYAENGEMVDGGDDVDSYI